jgi:hypothetical protein
MKPIVILGMHRSGTSATTRALGLLGGSLGPSESLGKFWENQRMRRLNERLLEEFGGGWECPPVLPEGWLDAPAVRAEVAEGRAALAGFGRAPVIVWKDPRTCTTLPFWLPLFDEPPVLVVVYRHPVEVAGSLRTRNQLGPAHSFAVWERFNRDALVNAVGHPTAVVRYVDLVEAPSGTMRRLVDALAGWGVELPNDPETTDMELAPGRRHHQSDAVDVFDDPISTPSQRELFGLLGELPPASDGFVLPGAPPEPSPLSTEMLELAAKARFAHRDARRARYELARLTGSRRRLLKRLVDSTLHGGRNGRVHEPTAP